MTNTRGFTLIEVIVAVSLLAVISLLVWQATGSTIASKERFEKKDQAVREANLAINQLTRDLQVAVLYVSPDMLGVSPDGEQQTKSAFIGENNGDQDKINFESLSHVRYLKDVKESDLAEVGYFLQPDPEDPELFSLMKREQSPPDTDPIEGGRVTELLSSVKEFNLRYYDITKQEFKDSWDTTSIDFGNRLPRAIEITLTIPDPVDEEAEMHFSTIVLLEMSPGPNDF